MLLVDSYIIGYVPDSRVCSLYTIVQGPYHIVSGLNSVVYETSYRIEYVVADSYKTYTIW